MNVNEFDEFVNKRNKIREEIYIRLAADMSNNKTYDDLFEEAHKAAIAYLDNALCLTDKDVNDISNYVGIRY